MIYTECSEGEVPMQENCSNSFYVLSWIGFINVYNSCAVLVFYAAVGWKARCSVAWCCDAEGHSDFPCGLLTVFISQFRVTGAARHVLGLAEAPQHDLCTHNIFTVPHRSSYFSLTLIIEMRHLARLNGGPVAASRNYVSLAQGNYLFFQILIPFLGLSGPVPLTSTLDFIYENVNWFLGHKGGESVEHCWSLERYSVSQKKMGLSAKTSVGDLSIVPRVGSWPRPSPSHPTPIVPLFVVKTKIIGDSTETYSRGCKAILSTRTVF